MNSSLKLILAVVITAVIASGGVYIWQQNQTLDVQQTEVVAEPTVVPSLLETAKNSKDDFIFLVSAPKFDSDWQLLLSNGTLGRLTFNFKLTPWGQMRYKVVDLTATGGGVPENGLAGQVAYEFCAGQYYCNLEKKRWYGLYGNIMERQIHRPRRQPRVLSTNRPKIASRNGKFHHHLQTVYIRQRSSQS